jgi:ADP-heptose:LPS heptosyltransferase
VSGGTGPRVLLARLDNAGDVLLMGPAVRAVAAAAGRVTFLAGPAGRAAAELLPGVDEVIEFAAPWILADPPPVDAVEVQRLVDRVAALRPDAAIVFGSFHQSPLPTALLLRMAGVPLLAATSVDYPGSLLDLRHRVADDVHEVERALDLVAAAGFPLPADDDGRLAVRRLGRSPVPAGLGPYVVVHPGASVPARAWAPERHAELVAALAGAGRRVVVTGGPGERELCELVAGGTAVDVSGTTDLADLAAVLAGADAVVTANTGPAHLAAAVGTPVVSLFAPTVPAVRWRPWGVAQMLLGDQNVPCAGCRARECPVPGHPCLGSITTREVVSAVDALAPLKATA